MLVQIIANEEAKNRRFKSTKVGLMQTVEKLKNYRIQFSNPI